MRSAGEIGAAPVAGAQSIRWFASALCWRRRRRVADCCCCLDSVRDSMSDEMALCAALARSHETIIENSASRAPRCDMCLCSPTTDYLLLLLLLTQSLASRAAAAAPWRRRRRRRIYQSSPNYSGTRAKQTDTMRSLLTAVWLAGRRAARPPTMTYIRAALATAARLYRAQTDSRVQAAAVCYCLHRAPPSASASASGRL